LVLPETEFEAGVLVAEKVRTLLASMPFATRAGDIHVTASFGVSATGSVGPDLDLRVEGLIKVADQCLYRSKQGGRDRTTGLEIPGSRALAVNA
jgi:two-component system cell cycle response regulator